ncbi:MAG: polysaccharide biosynthesis protein [Rickettsiales bacterium]
MKAFFRQPLNVIAVLHDCAMAALSFVVAMYLRLSDQMFARDLWWQGALAFSLVLMVVMLVSRTYRRLWRYTSLNDLMTLAKVGTIAMAIFYLGSFQITRLDAMPRSVVFIHWMTLMVCLMGLRVFWRVVSDRSLIDRFLGRGRPRVPVMLIGATAQAEMFIRESERNHDFPYRVVAIIDDEVRKHGREIHHVRVYGSVAEAGYIIKKLIRKGRAPQRMLLTDPNTERTTIEQLLEVGQQFQVTLARLPGLTELRDGNRAYEAQPVAVEDILGRPPAMLDRPAMRALVAGKRVLVTGAGGSIGSELVRQIAAFAPAQITLYELSEFHLYEIDRELAETANDLLRHAILGDVRDKDQLHRVMQDLKPEIVFHAAAIKHVPLSEENPDQAVLTNVLGSKQVADCCIANHVSTMVQISTDKAVNPTSIMGASKRAAEIYCQALAQDGCSTRFITVRFGNVLNSAGSVVPLFQKQLAKGGPLTVTHKDMTRYFMTISEAVQLVLQAAVLGADVQEKAVIYVLDMGAPIRIEELACQMIRLAGFKPYEDIQIVFTGLRPGEKLFEELFHDAENLTETKHLSIRQAKARALDRIAILSTLQRLTDAARTGDKAAVRETISLLIPEYHP